MRRAMGKLANRTVTVPRRHPELTFLTKADMTLEDWKFGELMDQGRKACVPTNPGRAELIRRCSSWRSGKEVAALYKRFLESGDGVFSRSTGGARVVETAGYWLQVKLLPLKPE